VHQRLDDVGRQRERIDDFLDGPVGMKVTITGSA
jgi:hypothetical protein